MFNSWNEIEPFCQDLLDAKVKEISDKLHSEVERLVKEQMEREPWISPETHSMCYIKDGNTIGGWKYLGIFKNREVDERTYEENE